MTTTELIELLKKHERGGATGRPREVMFEVGDRIIDTDGIEVTGSGDGLISELYLSLPSAQPTLYGYEIEHLAYIARVMQKEGVTAEYAVRTFGDMSRASRMIIEELQEKVEKSLSAMQLPSAQPEIEERREETEHFVPKEDSISRKAAIEALESEKVYMTAHEDGVSIGNIFAQYNRGLSDGVDKLKQLPAAEPEPKWIPCSERLPEDGKWCIFTDGDNISVERYKFDALDHFFPPGRWFDLDDAVAWMPLPAPYREEDEE